MIDTARSRGNLFIAALACLSLFSYGLCLTMIGPALGQIQRNFGLSGSAAGLLFTAQSAGFLAAVLFGGYLVDRAGIRVIMLAGQSLLTAGILQFGLAGSYPVLIASIALTGAAGGLIEIAANTLISDLNPERRARALNILHIFFGLGGLAGPLLSGAILSVGYAWNGSYLAAAGLSAAVFILLLMGNIPARAASAAGSIDLSVLSKILRSRTALLLGLITICYVGAEMGINSWSVLYLERARSMEKMPASALLANFWLAMTLGRIACAILVKKLGEKNLLIVLGLAATALYILFLLAPHPAASGACLAAVGLAFSGIFPTLIALGGNRFPGSTGTITGFVMACAGLGFMTVPWLMGMVTSAGSLVLGMWMLVAILAVLTGCAVLLSLSGD